MKEPAGNATRDATRAGLRIALIGSRGIPAGYGGFETFAEQLAPRLVARGHSVTVYCRRGYTADDSLREYKGVTLRHTPALRSRSFEQLSHEATSILDSLRRRFDLYYFLGYRGAPFYIPLRLMRRPVVLNTDGFEWKRRKWNAAGRAYLRFAEWLAAHVAADELVADARAIADYYRTAHHRQSRYVTYGAYVYSEADLRPDVLDRYDLRLGRYYLVVSRIEPENNLDVMIREFVAAGSDKELVIVGGMNYETPHWQKLRQLAEGHPVRFLGPIYGPMLIESLQLGAYAYLHGHEVGGTNPALLNAMGCGNLALALETEFNKENAADAGRYWTKHPGSLAEMVRWADAHPAEVGEYGRRARIRIAEHYTWDRAADQHDALFREVAARRARAMRG